MKLPKPSKPKLTMSIRKPKGEKQAKVAKAAKADKVVKAKPKTPSVRVPQPVEDLYRDMRDRRLLLPAVALIAALVAVPVALSTPAEEPPPPPVLQAPEGAEAVAPAVLTEQPVGVRDYRERLADLKSKNPFAGSFTVPSSGGGDGGDGGDELSTSATDTSGAASPSTSTSTAGETPTSAPVDDGSVQGQPDGGSSSGGDEILVLAPRIDVRGGPVGNRKRVKGVKIGDLVPDERKAPIAMFLGVSEDLKRAQFAVSGDVTETEGDGQCHPRANDCEFLRLREDEKQYFTFEDERYSLKVTDIREVVVERRKLDVE